MIPSDMPKAMRRPAKLQVLSQADSFSSRVQQGYHRKSDIEVLSKLPLASALLALVSFAGRKSVGSSYLLRRSLCRRSP